MRSRASAGNSIFGWRSAARMDLSPGPTKAAAEEPAAIPKNCRRVVILSRVSLADRTPARRGASLFGSPAKEPQATSFRKLFKTQTRCLLYRTEKGARKFMEIISKDLRYGLRMLAKSPGFTIVAVFALALGIGANTAIFSLFNGMLWRPLPAKDPQQLVSLSTQAPSTDFPLNLSYLDFQDYRQLKSVFSDLIAFTPSPVNFGAEGQPERAWAERVSGNYFSMLGLQPALG